MYSLCDDMYLVIYFFVPSHEVYLHDVTNMYLVIYHFVWRLTFDCAQMCFPKRHPPMRGRGYMRLFVCSSSPASCVFLVLRSATPLHSTGRDDDCETCYSPSGLVLIMHAFSSGFAREGLHKVLRLSCREGSRLAFGFRATGLSTLRFHATGFC